MTRIVHSEIWRATRPGLQGYSDGAGSGSADPPTAGQNDGTTAPLAAQSWRDGGNSAVWSFTVPSNCEVACDRLVIQVSPGGLWDMAASSPSMEQSTPRATAVVKIDGNAIHELQVWSRGNWQQAGSDASTANKGSWGAQSLGSRPEQTVVALGAGVTLTSGQVLTVEVSPSAITLSNGGMLPSVIRFTGVAADEVTGRAVFIHGSYRPADASASQLALSFTAPANGIKLRSFAAWAEGGLLFALARAQIHLNDAMVHELGYLNASIWRTRGETIAIPLGFTLQQGDCLEIRGCPLADTGGVISTQLIGTKRGVGYARGRA